MFTYYFQGLALGSGYDIAAWPTKCLCDESGIRRQYHLMIALLCAVSDLLLICAGIFGGSALLMQSPVAAGAGDLGRRGLFCCGMASAH